MLRILILNLVPYSQTNPANNRAAIFWSRTHFWDTISAGVYKQAKYGSEFIFRVGSVWNEYIAESQFPKGVKKSIYAQEYLVLFKFSFSLFGAGPATWVKFWLTALVCNWTKKEVEKQLIWWYELCWLVDSLLKQFTVWLLRYLYIVCILSVMTYWVYTVQCTVLVFSYLKSWCFNFAGLVTHDRTREHQLVVAAQTGQSNKSCVILHAFKQSCIGPTHVKIGDNRCKI